AGPHGFLIVKAESSGTPIDEAALRVVEVVANLAAVGFDNLRLHEVERRRSRVTGMVSRLGRTLINVHEPSEVLRLATDALRSVLDASAVVCEVVRDGGDGRTAASGPLASPRVVKALPDEAPGSL